MTVNINDLYSIFIYLTNFSGNEFFRRFLEKSEWLEQILEILNASYDIELIIYMYILIIH